MEQHSIFSLGHQELKKIIERRTKEFLTEIENENENRIEKCLQLINEGINYQNVLTNDSQRQSLIQYANIQVIEKLLVLPDIQIDEKSLMLVNAAVYNKLEIVKLLSEKHNILSAEAIHSAIEEGHVEIMLYLLQHDENFYLDAESYSRMSLLQNAVFSEKANMVKILLENYHINPHHRKNDSRTPLYLAKSKQNQEIIELLCNHGAELPVEKHCITDSYSLPN